MMTFSPAFGLGNAHIQTLLSRFIRRKPLFQAVRERLELPDGDFVDLAWSEDPNNHSDKPIFVLFHGLEGSFESPYANGLLHAFAKQGWLSVMMHFRGCSGEPNRLPRAYHSGETEDARHFLTELSQRFPSNSKVAVGVSLGGNMLVNYLAKYGNDTKLDAASIVSAPLDLLACSRRINQGFSKVYQDYLLGSLKDNAIAKLPLVQKVMPLTESEINKISTMFEFDDVITSRLHGFNGAHHYYQTCSGLPMLPQIRIPTDIIHAHDDPFMTEAVIPDYPLPAHVNYHLLPKGGHVGFVTGSLFRPKFWLEEALPEYYSHFLKVAEHNQGSAIDDKIAVTES
ncbi:putative hydrolase [Vibrio nigripulchritudo ATCC 27043]|uniref:hydrolase n=1 Tax=Vibrio nigripulchritudo TaxID=28173 RepID=UPI00021C29B3|nr:hydrolase [Vibrio nigripulchritudo]EGU61004.1 putative hydrolase [Vibrio nigripulchritudo ATCC 27043]CCN72076.1 putative yheT related alpha/beta-hydrolase [Vibrio nigripulchritudo SFn118]